MPKKAAPKAGVENRVLTQDPNAPTAKPLERQSATERVQSIPSVDAGLSAPRGMSAPIGGLPLAQDYGRLKQSPNVRPADRTPNLGRAIGTTTTRGHGSTAEHVRQLEATANFLGVSTEVSTRGQIRGLSRNSPVEPPSPTRVTNKKTGESKQILYTDRTDKGAPVYGGGRVGIEEAKRWGRAGRSDLLDVAQQYQTIATPGGIDRGPTDKVDTRRGARGAFSGMNPEELQDAVKAEILPDRVNRAVSDLMRPDTFNRARKIQKPWGVGSELTPEQKEKTDTVRVTKGKKTTTMTQAKHQERAEKRIAKRKKAEGGY